MTGQPLWRISRADLDKLMTSLAISHVRLTEPALTAGARLDIARCEHPALHYVYAGSGEILVEGERPIGLSAHTLVVVPARRSTVIAATPRPDGSMLRIRSASFLAVYAAGLDLFASQAGPIVETFDAHDQLDQVMNYAMIEHATQEVGGGAMSAALLKLVILSLLRRCLVSTNPWVERFSIINDPPIARAFAEMASRPAAPHTVLSLSQAVALSRSAFMARFAAAFGESPMAVLRRLRMRHAASLLAANALSIDQVAMQAGYQSRSSFTRSFRRHFGNDPSEYRAEAKRGSPCDTIGSASRANPAAV